MMKKLLILMILLVATSVASAGLYTKTILVGASTWDGTSDVLVGSIITFTLGADSTVSVLTDTVLNVDKASDWSSLTVLNTGNFISIATQTTTDDGSNGFNVNFAAAVDEVPANDDIYTFTFTANTLGTLTIDATGGTWGVFTAAPGNGMDGAGEGWAGAGIDWALPYIEMNITPEPMTLALLGLGGLCLRRRKK